MSLPDPSHCLFHEEQHNNNGGVFRFDEGTAHRHRSFRPRECIGHKLEDIQCCCIHLLRKYHKFRELFGQLLGFFLSQQFGTGQGARGPDCQWRVLLYRGIQCWLWHHVFRKMCECHAVLHVPHPRLPLSEQRPLPLHWLRRLWLQELDRWTRLRWWNHFHL